MLRPLCFALTTLVSSLTWAQSSAPAGMYTDPQIASVLMTANQGDIDAGKLAKQKSKSKDVKSFADDMIKDHTALNRSAETLARKLKMSPESSPLSESLKATAESNMGRLKALDGAAFDRAYADNEVTLHETVIKTVDEHLMPNVKNAELKDMLVQARPILVQHLAHAKRLQSSLAAGK